MIRHAEVPVEVTPTEPSNIANNQLAMTIITGVIPAPQALNMPAMEEGIAVTTVYKKGTNRNPWIVIRNGIDGSTPASGDSGTSAVDGSTTAVSFCPSLTPLYEICNSSIENIRQTTTPSFRETSELNTLIDRILYNNSNVTSIGSQILRDELPISSGGGYLLAL